MVLGKELPTWRQFFTRYSARKSTSFDSESKKCLYLAESCMSISLILRAIKKATKKEKVIIWIPDYFCNQTVRSFDESWVQIIYYPIGEDLTPKWDCIKKMNENLYCDVFLFVHYFGKYKDISRAREFCNLKESILIEDCAHITCQMDKYGLKGDFAIFSPHKTLPIPDGAILHINENAGNKNITGITNSLIREYEALPIEDNHFIWYMKKMIQKIFHIHRKSQYTQEVHFGIEYKQYHEPKKMSKHAYNIFCKYSYEDFKRIAYIRRDNLQMINYYILQECADIEALMDETVYEPYFAVFSLKKVENKKEVMEKILKKGYMVLYWPDLPFELKESESAQDAFRLSENIFMIPIHQDITYKHLVKRYSLKQIQANENTTAVQLDWENVTEMRWENILKNTNLTNIPQDWEYGLVKKNVEGWGLKRCVIVNSQGEDIGILQLLEKRFAGIVVALRINRGPILTDSYNTINVHIAAIKQIQKKIGKLIPFFYAPNIEFSPYNMEQMITEGWKCYNRFGYPSSTIDLTLSEEELRKRLKPFWRKHLKQAEKLVTIQENTENIDLLIELYDSFLKQKKIPGIPLPIIKELFEKYPEKLKILTAKNSDGKMIAYKILYLHGNTGTSFAAWNTEEGREKNARTLLIFSSMLLLKKSGFKNFDLGGVDDINTEAVAHFKRGVSGNDYRLLGEFINF